MSAENKAIVRRFYEEVVNKGNLAVMDELVATNFVEHNPSLPGMAPGVEGLKQAVTMFLTAFPDVHVTVEDMVAEGDKVVSRLREGGTHKGELMGMAPTGKQVTVEGIEIARISGGKIVEMWVSMDMLGMMQQMGVI